MLAKAFHADVMQSAARLLIGAHHGHGMATIAACHVVNSLLEADLQW